MDILKPNQIKSPGIFIPYEQAQNSPLTPEMLERIKSLGELGVEAYELQPETDSLVELNFNPETALPLGKQKVEEFQKELAEHGTLKQSTQLTMVLARAHLTIMHNTAVWNNSADSRAEARLEALRTSETTETRFFEIEDLEDKIRRQFGENVLSGDAEPESWERPLLFNIDGSDPLQLTIYENFDINHLKAIASISLDNLAHFIYSGGLQDKVKYGVNVGPKMRSHLNKYLNAKYTETAELTT